jgi:MoaA/NifB/PqqE/SkfB family radical SAM enzyme
LPYYITISLDLTCNLSCPSCRTSVTKTTEKQKIIAKEMGATLTKNLFSTPSDQEITLQISTSGELFASPMLLEFVSSIRKKDFPNVKLDIQTNGLLCEQYWHRLNELQSSVFRLTITFDAARQVTYEALRRGGSWVKLIKSMEFLALKKEEIGMIFHTRMVVQQQNYQEIEEFYEFSKKYGADQIQYTRLNNWNTRSEDEHFKEDVFNPKHAEYELACNMLARVKHFPLTTTNGGLP